MPHYVIEMAHDPAECVEALDEVDPRSEDLLNEIYWSCMYGEHVGRVVVEAETPDEARNMAPASVRNRVTVREAEEILPELAQAGVIDPETKHPLDSAPDAS